MAGVHFAIGKQRIGESPRWPSEADYVASINRQCKQLENAIFGLFKEMQGDISMDIMIDALRPTFEETQKQVPVETGALKASGYLEKSPEYSGGARVEMGYAYRNSPWYAQLVHENVASWHRSPTKAKFLQDPMMADLNNIYARLGALYKAALGA